MGWTSFDFGERRLGEGEFYIKVKEKIP